MAVRVATPEIRWHCGPTGLNEAVLSIDFLHDKALPVDLAADGQASQKTQGEAMILATGGADKEIKLWRVARDIEMKSSPQSSKSGHHGSSKKDSSVDQDKTTGDDAKAKDATAEEDAVSPVSGLDFIFSLSGHDRSVNCVRFSPNGQFLASASDDMSVIIWTKPKTAADDWRWDTITSFSDISRTLLACGHKGDITDLAWSPDSAFLCSTSVDNCSVIWNVEKAEVAERKKEHTQFVQGAAWDPLNEFLVTEGNDRTCRVYALKGYDPVTRSNGKKQVRKLTCVQTIKTREFDKPEPETADAKADPEKPAELDAMAEEPAAAVTARSLVPKHRMFLDDTCPVFARRPTWTPDGNYFLAPTGSFRPSEDAPTVNTVYAFCRGNLSEPTLHLPGQEKASLCIRCSPRQYELRREQANSDSNKPVQNLFQTPHRSVFAVITLNAVILYDTQQSHPICTLKDMHYAELTDASWSADGQALCVSSIDGYLSFIQFEPGFFGTCVSEQAQSDSLQERMKPMFSIQKIPRKKPAKQQNNSSTSTPEDAKTPVKKAAAVAKSSPLVRSFKKSEGDSTTTTALPTGGAVNTLQVRKKRKITPVLLNASAVSPAAAESKPTTENESEVIDLSATASPPQQQTVTRTTQSPTNGTAQDPISINEVASD